MTTEDWMDSCRLYLEHDDAIATGQFANCEPCGERRKTRASPIVAAENNLAYAVLLTADYRERQSSRACVTERQ